MARLLMSTMLMVGIVASPPSCSQARPPAPKSQPTAEHSQHLQFTGFVVDDARILNQAQRDRLTNILDRFQQRTGHQFAVVTVKSLSGEDITTFTTRLANRWGVGRKGIDDGIVFLFAPNERKTRIAVGFGLEKRLPNAICYRILSEIVIPAFNEGDMPGGIEAGAIAVIKHLNDEDNAQR